MNFNKFELENFAKTAARAYVDRGADLNSSIAKIAADNSLTGEQVGRVVENANILVNAAIVTSARDSGSDPRVTFDMADREKIAAIKSGSMTHVSDDHKLATLSKLAEDRSSYFVKAAEVDVAGVIDAVFGHLAEDPAASDPVNADDHVALAKLAMAGKPVPEGLDCATVSKISEFLDDMSTLAATKLAQAKTAMAGLEARIVDDIDNELLTNGTATATLRDVVSRARLDDDVSSYIDALVTKTAAAAELVEGQSACTDHDIINPRHPVVSHQEQIRDHIQAIKTAAAKKDLVDRAVAGAKSAYIRARKLAS